MKSQRQQIWEYLKANSSITDQPLSTSQLRNANELRNISYNGIISNLKLLVKEGAIRKTINGRGIIVLK